MSESDDIPLFTLRPDTVLTAPAQPIDRKHMLNPPVVTVFGAGVGGMTVAHELIERGFRVVVIESKPDPERPGECLVGGMAASQYGRVRATVEEVHKDLFEDDRLTPKTGPVEQWLLYLFLYNRTAWIQSDAPTVFSPIRPDDRLDVVADTARELRDKRQRRWLWELMVRPIVAGMVRMTEPNAAVDVIDPSPDRLDDRLRKISATLTERLAQFDALEAGDPHALAKSVIGQFQVDDDLTRAFKKALDQHPKAALKTITRELQREFLLVKVTPCWCPPDAGTLGLDEEHQKRTVAFDSIRREKVRDLRRLAKAFQDEYEKKGLADSFDILPPVSYTTEQSRAYGFDEGQCWLTLEIVEERIPGEHGYRFFPSFYRHLDDTMKRIPLGAPDDMQAPTVLKTLEPTEVQGIGMSTTDGRYGKKPRENPVMLRFGRKRPTSVKELLQNTIGFVQDLGGTDEDATLLNLKFLEFLTSSTKRRREQYQEKTWAEFIGLDRFSRNMQDQLKAAAQVLNAFSVEEADAYTYGNVAIQLLLDNLADGKRVDRTLEGPTSEEWLEPWRRYLEAQGVQFVLGSLEKLTPARNGELLPTINWIKPDVEEELERTVARSDFFVMATSVQATNALLTNLLDDEGGPANNTQWKQTAPDFQKFLHFWEKAHLDDVDGQNPLRDMLGIQFFFDSKTRVGDGHVYYPYSPWGLSTISQSEFWRRKFRFSDGYLGVLSVDLCDVSKEIEKKRKDEDPKFWDTLEQASGELGVLEAKLKIALEVWTQLNSRIAAPADVKGADPGIEPPRFFHLDNGVRRAADGTWFNSSPFLAVTPESWEARPGLGDDGSIEYQVNYKRWLMCGTFAATHTRMTTMEAANESARHVVSAILKRLAQPDASWKKVTIPGVPTPHWIFVGENMTYNGASSSKRFDYPEVFPLEDREPKDLDVLKEIDERLLDKDLPHFMEILQVDALVKHAFDTRELSRKLGLQLAKGSPIGRGKEQQLGGMLNALWALTDEVHDKLRDEIPDLPDLKEVVAVLRRFLEGLG
ncbi:MAG TPA: NAD(P)-binding protein [Polyangia bacterium]|jgi:hypothetical protein